jgi:hypothetical protein
MCHSVVCGGFGRRKPSKDSPPTAADLQASFDEPGLKEQALLLSAAADFCLGFS